MGDGGISALQVTVSERKGKTLSENTEGGPEEKVIGAYIPPPPDDGGHEEKAMGTYIPPPDDGHEDEVVASMKGLIEIGNNNTKRPHVCAGPCGGKPSWCFCSYVRRTW